ncbi:hypothetical protein ACFYXF_35160 [Streptomyces sp. NPDC002680]|uniref:hypothetical protein n=1 Tax=Streptomyces sp. NPDC002680 TaxID=3364659 RepID=UPI00367D3E6A
MRYFHGGVPGLDPGDLITPISPHVVDGCKVGEPEDSAEDPFPTWCVPAARVASVYTRAVQLTRSQRRSLLRSWTAADMARGR